MIHNGFYGFRQAVHRRIDKTEQIVTELLKLSKNLLFGKRKSIDFLANCIDVVDTKLVSKFGNRNKLEEILEVALSWKTEDHKQNKDTTLTI